MGDAAGGFIGLVFPLFKLAAIAPERGADTLVYLASSPDVADVTGEYFDKRRIAQPSPAARDDSAARRLWEASERLASNVFAHS